jgi:ABC-2 type transport system permease protein
MSRWRKVRTVATFEFLAAVKRPGYLIATFGMPLFMAAYGGIVAIPAYFVGQKEREPVVYGIVDDAGVLRLSGDRAATGGQPIPDEMRRTLQAAGQGPALERALTSDNFVFRPFPNEHEARTALAGRTLKGYFVIPAGYLGAGEIDAYSPDTFTFSTSDARDAIADLLRERLVVERLDAETSARVLKPIARTRRFAVTRTGEARDGGMLSSIVRLAVPLIFMILFLISVLMTSGYLMQGTATEKENKVVEVLLSSANPDEILAGKLLGLGGAGLLQISVWLSMLMATGLGVIPMLFSTRVDVPWLALAIAVPFFIVAFLFFGSLMLGTGSLGSNMREAQQLAMVWSLTAAAPMMMMMVLLREPNGTVAKVMSWIPFTAAPLIMLRATTDAASLAWWEIAGSFLVLVAGTWVALRVGARLFRIGLLSAGARPSLREIVRQARLAA